MKDAEDEAFDELARRQGAWGGGFDAKRQMAMDKINSDFDEEYKKMHEDRVKYGTSWEKDGKRIDPMSVYKEPAAMDDRQRLEAIVSVINKYLPPLGMHIMDAMSAIISLVDPLPPPQPAQEPVACVMGTYGGMFVVGPLNSAVILPVGMALYVTPQHTATWAGLTDEDCVGMSAGDKVVAMWANRILKEKNT